MSPTTGFTRCACSRGADNRALRRRDVYASGGSARWGDPRARLLSGPAPRPVEAISLVVISTANRSSASSTDDACSARTVSYVGASTVIQAPHTGALVNYSPNHDGDALVGFGRVQP